MSLSSERLLIPQLLALAMQIKIVVFHYTIYIKGVTPVAGRDFDPPTPDPSPSLQQRTIFLPSARRSTVAKSQVVRSGQDQFMKNMKKS